jgi:hypothetical protein
MDKRALQTQFSIQASSLAESYRSTVGRLRVGPHGYSPDMTAPEGVSTGGGVQALQHLRLLPPQPNMPTLLVGHANRRDGAAELRTWEHVDAICRERFKQGAPLDPAQYEEFLESAQGFLAACGMRVSRARIPDDFAAGGRAPMADGGDSAAVARRFPFALVAGAVMVVLALVAVWRLVVAK